MANPQLNGFIKTLYKTSYNVCSVYLFGGLIGISMVFKRSISSFLYLKILIYFLYILSPFSLKGIIGILL